MTATASQRSIDSLLLPTQVTSLLAQIVEKKGISVQALFRNTGVRPEDLDDDDKWISYRQTMRIIDNAYRLTGCNTLGLDVGMAEDLSTFGILGYAMMSCDTLKTAIEIADRYHRTAQSLCEHRLEFGEELVSIFAATPFVLTLNRYRFAMEELFTGINGLFGTLTGVDVIPVEVHFAYAEPAYSDRYYEAFRCKVKFDEKTNQLIYRRHLFDLPVLQANRFNAQMTNKLCQGILDKHVGEEDLASRIRQIIVQVPGQFPGEEEVARSLNISSRSMRRYLAEYGTSFRRLLDEVRADLSQNYLMHSLMSIDQIAYVLGYTETTNFRRAFKGWVGVSPTKFRRNPVH